MLATHPVLSNSRHTGVVQAHPAIFSSSLPHILCISQTSKFRQKGIWDWHKCCIFLFAKSRAIYIRAGVVCKIYFIHLTYTLAEASTVSHECIKQYGTKLVWSELLIKITDCIKWSSFISAALAKPSCELMRIIYYWSVFHWTTTVKAAQFSCFTSNSGCPLATRGSNLC